MRGKGPALSALLATACLIAVGSAATAQPLSSSDIENFVKSSLSGTTMLSRWRDGICPLAAGFSDPHDNDRVMDRIRQVAAMAGAPVAASPCTANIHIYFTSDPQALLNSIRDHGGGNLLAGNQSQTATHPIQAWYTTVLRDGHSGALASANSDTVAEFGGARLISELAHVYVIVDVNQTRSYGFAAVPDYVAMLSLSQMQIAGGCQKVPSITNLVFPDCGDAFRPAEIAAADQAYLKAVYGEDLHQPFRIQRSDIAVQMQKTLTSP